MARPKKVIKEEEKPQEPSFYEKVHKKTFRQLLEDSQKEEVKEEPKEEVTKDTKDEAGEEVVGSSEANPQPKEEKIDIEKIKQEAKAEAEKITNEKIEAQKKEFQAKLDEILSKDKNREEQQKEADDLIAIWEKENRLPKDWREIANEQVRIADTRLNQRLKEKEEAEKKLREEEKANLEKQQIETKEQEAKRLEDFQKQLGEELDELYAGNFIKRPADINEINNEKTVDEAAKETRELFAYGVKLNLERKEKGLPPVTSLSKIFFMHYKPNKEAAGKKDDQPAGADAPVSGGTATPPQEGEKGFIYARDHNKSFRQILYEGLRKSGN